MKKIFISMAMVLITSFSAYALPYIPTFTVIIGKSSYYNDMDVVLKVGQKYKGEKTIISSSSRNLKEWKNLKLGEIIERSDDILEFIEVSIIDVSKRDDGKFPILKSEIIDVGMLASLVKKLHITFITNGDIVLAINK